MKNAYEIQGSKAEQLGVGSWVEIFEAYGSPEGKEAIRVRSMRVGGKIYVFGGSSKKRSARGLRPHEGQIVHIERGPARVRFNLRLQE